MAKKVRVGGVCPPRPAQDAPVTQIIKSLKEALQSAFYDRPDFLLLPECCDIPAGMHGKTLADFLAARGDAVLSALCDTARKNDCALGFATLLSDENDGLFNALLFIDRTGALCGQYRKIHPMIEENVLDGVKYGSGFVPVDAGFGTIGGLICFDLNFSDVADGWKKVQPDLLAFSSMFHGGPLQNQLARTVGRPMVSSVSGMNCSLLDALGNPAALSSNYTPFITAALNLDCGVYHLDGNAPKLRRLKADLGPAVRIDDPGCIGCVILSSETDEYTVNDLAAAYGLEPRDAYFARALRHREEHLS